MNVSLPQTGPPENDQPPVSALHRVRYGASGWDYRDWQGPLYPKPLPKGFRGLPLLAQFTHFMEVNSTFYHPMGGDRAGRWLAETPAEFTFVIKAFRDWTHRGAAVRGTALRAFREILDPILAAERLEGVLAQYPPSFCCRGTDLPSLEPIIDLAKALAPAPVFIEVRHNSLYRADFLNFLQDAGLGFVNVDLPRWQALPRLTTINTNQTAYVRLHGRSLAGWSAPRSSRDQRYDYSYPDAEIKEIVSTIRSVTARTSRVLVAANNHFRAQAPATLVAIRSGIEGRTVPTPCTLVAAFPHLRPIAHTLPPRGGL